MITLRRSVALPVLAAIVLSGACAASEPATSIPPGCEPAADRLTWSPSSTTPLLVSARDPAGTVVLDEPFEPSVAGLDAPRSWLPDLAGSLRATAGHEVLAATPDPAPQEFSLPPDRRASALIYTGVERVTADFELRCDPPVHGTFHGWSRTVTDVVFCQDNPPDVPDDFTRLALELCPDRPSSAA
ncbi:hypothetical protein [Actinoplanes solisilvae]|uniref:hypothetical protein n=1 Tax=Actinoplanes solisilvae TaxID=2486853 RepID=UPI000FDC4E8A|nr:hypothetical protein [Actinoplanes solisilvae]